MSKFLRLFIALCFFASVQAKANPEKEFIMSCTYGVLAGTLVGAASLAFVDKPGENLQLVARGASIGLYMGIGLGLYTVYILPKKIEKREEELLEGDDTSNNFHFMVFPVASEKGIDGIGGFVQLASF